MPSSPTRMQPKRGSHAHRAAQKVREGMRAQWHRFFILMERAGVHVTPVHYYSGLPNISGLKKSGRAWRKRSSLSGIEIDLNAQAENLERICLPFRSEYGGLSVYDWAAERNGEPGYGEIESQALHSFVRHFRPRRIVQVGCGLATHCILRAVEMNESPCEFTCIEPYPNSGLKAARGIHLI